MEENSRNDLILLLARHFAVGKLESKDVLPVIRQLLGEQPGAVSRLELLTALEKQDHPAVRRLREELQRAQLKDAYACYCSRRAGVVPAASAWPDLAHLPLNAPLEWQGDDALFKASKLLLVALRNWYFIKGRAEKLSGITAELEKLHGEMAGQLAKHPSRWRYLTPDAALISDQIKERMIADRQRLEEAARKVLDRLTVDGHPPLGGVESLLTDLDEDIFLDQLQQRYEVERGNLPANPQAGREKSAEGRSRRTGQQALLDLILTWPTDRAAPLLLSLCREEWEQERAGLVLMLRFGKADFRTWNAWFRWLTAIQEQAVRRKEEFAGIREWAGADVLLCWCAQQENPDPEILGQLASEAMERARTVDPEAFVEQWRESFAPGEINKLLGLGNPPPLSPPISAAVPRQPPPLISEPASRVPPVIPVESKATLGLPSQGAFATGRVVKEKPVEKESEAAKVWHEHVQPFLAGNWYMVAGLVMVIVGASLLAYFTWDKHWLIRYTIMPLLLALLTMLLARTGSWLEAKSPALKATGAMLRGAAIGLLPINFMAVALLSRDPDVRSKTLLVPLMAVIYVGVFGWQLRRWCAAVHPSLGLLQGMSLLGLNALVALGPLALLVTDENHTVRFLLGVGFHLGFFGLMASVRVFSRRVLTMEMVLERRVPWFFVMTLGITFLQVFGLVHWSMRYLPKAATYAPLVILSGSLVLFLERRFLELRSLPATRQTGQNTRYGGESFLGFALVLLGLLMGMKLPDLRILCFALAGGVWLYQASFRPGIAHDWIGLTLLMLAGASIGLLDQFPKSREANWLPALGIALALAFGLLRIAARRLGAERLALAAVDFQPMVLVLTAMVSVLSQWRYRSEPIWTAAALVVIAAFFGWRAHRVQRLGWVHTAMALLALALPYLGCVDMAGRSLHGNTMVFGLGILSGGWLTAIRFRPTPLLVQARSTIIWTFGGLAVAGMLVRVMMERGAPGDFFWQRALMDYTGPYLMTASLLVAAYHSRSVIPSVMAAIIFAVLFPELKARFKEWYPLISWGSGLGSAGSALALTLLCFPLKRWPLLQNLGEGDLFLGKTPFPGQRRDHTLFTVPLIGAVIFLIARVDAWTLVHQLARSGVEFKTAMAVGISGIVWTLLAAHLRKNPFGKAAFHLGWMALFLGFLFSNKHIYEQPRLQIAILSTGLLLQALYFVYRSLMERRPWVADLLFQPTKTVLRRGSLLFAWIVVFYLSGGGELRRVQWLGAFLLVQLAWHAISTGKTRHGAATFALVLAGLLAWVAPGRDVLPVRLSLDNALAPVLYLALAVQLIQLILEFDSNHPAQGDFSLNGYARLRALLVPSQVGSIFLVLMGAFVGAKEMLGAPVISLTATHATLLSVALMLTARANRSGELALIAMTLGYLFLHIGELGACSSPESRVLFLLTPWRAAAFALSLAVLGHLGRRIHDRAPSLLSGAYCLGTSCFSPSGWIFLPAAALAVQAAFYHTISPYLRMEPVQLWAPCLGTIALAIIGFSWRREVFLIMAGVVLCAANVHAVNVFAGGMLDRRGLSDIHVVCLGLVFTLLQGTLIRIFVRGEAFVRRLNQGSTLLAAIVLALLSFNYFVHPNLGAITVERFMVSGSLAFAAALYFRHAARHPGPGEEGLVDWCAGFYHFGVAMTLWCLILLVPDFRHPFTALLALGIPAVYFYLRTEFGLRSTRKNLQTTAAQYRNSATTMGFLLLALYVFRAAFQMILFPGEEIVTDHYHYNAPVIMLLAFLLIRLHGLGGTWWLAFYGGLALITGAWFSVTSWPGLSPFDQPVSSAWVAAAMAHLFIAGSYQRSPLRSVVQELGGIGGDEWLTLRRYWGRCLLAASQIVILIGILRHGQDPWQVAPLLAAAASIFIHQGIVGKIRWYFVAAAIQLAVALHADFILPSYLAKDDVIWVILGLWGATVSGWPFWKRWLTAGQMGPAVALLFGGCAAHVFYHHPAGQTGLWAVAVMAVLGALTPRQTRNPATAEQSFAAGLLLLALPWLVYFSQTRILDGGIRVAFEAWPVLATTASLFATGVLIRVYRKKCAPVPRQTEVSQPRLYQQTLSLFEQFGDRIHSVLLWITFAVTSLVMAVHYQSAFAIREIMLCCLLWAGYSAAWFVEGRDRAQIIPNIIAQLSVFAFFIAVRRHLMLTTTFWTCEYDVWASLAISCCLTGAKQFISRQAREVRFSLMGSLFVLPVVGLSWTLIHGLGPDIALTVVGLQSLMFAFLGKDERESPYNIVAIGGFALFVIILFWAKLELRALHAYVIPVGLGVLVLLQIFGCDLSQGSRNRIRLVTLLAMIGSTAYYALVDERYPLIFNITLLLLCLSAMAFGSLLKIRLYLALGFGGMLLAVSSIVYKVVVQLDRTCQMTSIGLLLLLLGVGLVAGSAYYKTHRDEFEGKLSRLRSLLGNWD